MFNHNRIHLLLTLLLSYTPFITAQDSSTASSPFLSLSDLQLITSNAIPISCILAYNSPIIGCQISDFRQGNPCSIACRQGIRRKEATLGEICSDVDVPVRTLLGLALQGLLEKVLCPAPGQGTVVTSSIIPTGTTAVRESTTATTVRETTTRGNGAGEEILTFTTVRPPTSSVTSSSAAAETTTVTTDRGVESTTATIVPTFVQSAGPSSTTSEEAPAETGGDGEETVVPNAGGGGGSPFDTILAVNAGEGRRSNLGAVFGMVIGIGMMLWR
ncbi:hypothetical protein QBC40DRAFT_185523 [Triangularia verruculosa]|uniref:Extracellular membrane protein CFEM domain-containing protein n=1 Tax=Triangularia verruculosa TaxID=2587418 RepID=A0AAN6X7T6_9PEZI|nr:hypothetical protein QBC40DRAFT_185523 [Triangularia verruculosa]